MAAAPRANPAEFFADEQWRQLTARSSWRGLLLVAHCWTVIALTMAVGALWPVVIPLAVLGKDFKWHPANGGQIQGIEGRRGLRRYVTASEDRKRIDSRGAGHD